MEWLDSSGCYFVHIPQIKLKVSETTKICDFIITSSQDRSCFLLYLSGSNLIEIPEIYKTYMHCRPISYNGQETPFVSFRQACMNCNKIYVTIGYPTIQKRITDGAEKLPKPTAHYQRSQRSIKLSFQVTPLFILLKRKTFMNHWV